jgi:thiol-disulfide isomerase/thioredoxin
LVVRRNHFHEDDMKTKFWKWAFVGLSTILLLGALGAVAFLKFVEYRMAQNLERPKLSISFTNGADFPYTTLDGQTRHISELKGKVVFVNFWGSWCLPCVVEMPTIEKLHEKFGNDPSVEFVIASRLDSPGRVKSYASRHHYDLPFYTIRDEDIPISMRFNQYPATFIYAKDGSLVAKHIGAANWADKSVVGFINKLKAMDAPNTALEPTATAP